MQKLKFINGNGVEIDLTDKVNFGITAWEGFSADSLNIQSQQVPFQDGGVFLDALMEQRELSVTVAINAKGNLEKRYRLRRELISVLNPKLGEGVLIYTDNYLSKQIHVIPQIPLFDTNNSNDSGTPKASCSFTACNPYWEDLEETEVLIPSGSNAEIINNGDVKIAIKARLANVDSVIAITNFNTQETIETTQSKVGDIYIDTNAGKKEIVLTESEYNLIAGGVINGGVVYQDNIILCGSNIYKLNYLDNKISLVKNNQESLVFYDITYSPLLNLFIAVTGYKIFSSSNLKEWTEVLSDGSYNTYMLISWEDSKFKVSSGGSTSSKVSTDGVNWTTQSTTINKNKEQVLYKNNYYRVYSSRVQKSSNGSSWENVTDSIGARYLLIAYGRLYCITDNGGLFVTENGTTWVQIRLFGKFEKTCIAFDKIYIMKRETKNDICYLNSEGELKTVVYKNDTTSDTCYDIFFKNGILLLLTSSGVYKSTDGSSFTKVVNLSDNPEGNIFYNDSTNKYCVVAYKNSVYTSADCDVWEAIGFTFPSYQRIEQGHMTFFNGAYYYGFIARIDYEYERIVKSTDLQNFTEVYAPTEVSDFLGFQDVYADSEQIIFSEIGCVLRSIDGNTFTKINCFNSNIRVNNIRKFGDTFYITGYDYTYYTTKDFVTMTQNDSPQLNAFMLFDLNKLDNKFYYVGTIDSNSGYFLGGDTYKNETNIIDCLAIYSSLSFNLEKGPNIIYFNANNDSVCRILFRQKYIGV